MSSNIILLQKALCRIKYDGYFVVIIDWLILLFFFLILYQIIVVIIIEVARVDHIYLLGFCYDI